MNEEGIALGFKTDDPDSQRLITFAKVWIWPGVKGLIILAVAAWLIPGEMIVAAFKACSIMWLVCQLIWRPRAFFKSVRDFFGHASKWLADNIGPLVKRANAWFQRERRQSASEKAQVRETGKAAATMGLASPAAAAPLPPPTPPPTPAPASPAPALETAPAKRWRFEWPKWLSLRLVAIVAGVLFVAFAFSSCQLPTWLGGATGREVAAECKTNIAEAEQQTAEAEAQQSRQAIERLEERNRYLENLNARTNNVRSQIANAPDLDTGATLLDEFTRGVFDEASAARAAAVSNYNSSLGT